MRKVLLAVVVASLLASSANAALLFLSAADGGGDKIELAPGGSADVNLMITVRDIDVGIAFTNVFLDDDDNLNNGEVDVTGLVEGIYDFYDRTAMQFPNDDGDFPDISWDTNNEYGLVSGSPEAEENFGPGTYVLDTLTLTHNGGSEVGGTSITFEKGARAPQISGLDFVIYPWGLGFDNVIPGFADPGAGGTDTPFGVNFIPEPATLALVAFGGLALLRRRS